MSLNWSKVIKYLWIVTGLFMLPLGLGTCLGDPRCGHAWDILPVMLLLSFPSGALVLLVVALLFGPASIAPPFDYSLVWAIAFAAGYAQWFWLVPTVFGRSEITTLGLTCAITSRAVGPEVENPPALLSTAPRIADRASKRAPRTTGRNVHFDGKGRTPLERVICRKF